MKKIAQIIQKYSSRLEELTEKFRLFCFLCYLPVFAGADFILFDT